VLCFNLCTILVNVYAIQTEWMLSLGPDWGGTAANYRVVQKVRPLFAYVFKTSKSVWTLSVN